MSVCETSVAYQPSLFELDDFFHFDQKLTNISLNSTSGLQPLLKWPGGKEKEWQLYRI